MAFKDQDGNWIESANLPPLAPTTVPQVEVPDALVASIFKRLVAAGIYVGMTNDAKFDFVKTALGLASTNFNAIVIHLLSPWNATGDFWPWAFDSHHNVFDLTQQNQAWFDHLEGGLDALMSAGIAPHLKWLDIYQDPQWGAVHFRPFYNNTFGKSLTGQELYDSWSTDGHGGVTHWWLDWQTDPHNKWIPINFKPVAPFGQPLWSFVDAVMAICKRMRAKHPTVPIMYAYANECMSTTDGSGHYIHGGKSIGSGPEVQAWFWERWAAAGFKRSNNPWTADGHLKNFIEFWNMDCVGPGNKPDVTANAKALPDTILHTMAREVHSVDGPPAMNANDVPAQDFIHAGCDPKKFLLSRDGTNEHLPQAAANARQLYQSGYPLIDIKFLMPNGGHWSNNDMQSNVDQMIPFMKQIAS